ncbi:MAG: hypothetical protein WBN92_04405, partial [Terriglobia bacterium]
METGHRSRKLYLKAFAHPCRPSTNSCFKILLERGPDDIPDVEAAAAFNGHASDSCRSILIVGLHRTTRADQPLGQKPGLGVAHGTLN